jgi:hypothetical protein
MEAWDCYRMYIGLKLHFTTDYDYKKYGGKTSATKASFLKRRDRNFFAKTARKYDDKTLDYFIANFTKSPKVYIGEFSEENYMEWSKNKQSLSYNFINDMSTIFMQVYEFNEIFSCYNGQHSVLLKNFLAKRIRIESMVILEGLLSYVRNHNEDMKNDLIWPDTRRLIVKYGAFLTYDKHKCRLQLLKLIKETF